MDIGIYSDVGLVREVNEDFVLVDEASGLYIVCDGMGGYLGGEVASKEAALFLLNTLKRHDFKSLSEREVETIILDTFDAANKHVYEMSLTDHELTGMGTTAVVALMDYKRVWICHVGDSGAYVITGRQLKKLTKDHSLVQELLDAGTISQAQALTHPKRNVITQALGSELPVKPQLISYELYGDDILLLCTDGLTNMVSREDILSVVLTAKSNGSAAKKLVELANEHGGKDNTSIILIGAKAKSNEHEEQVK
ncbi:MULTISPECIES: Stp1/IreP family PP2C-type Ser/Thr phosphatase [unclassified Fusibacter]|uniref:Stp1/IreP family PP2C-type Ser/Thr phosphatase n=1 Tax=unclassified Fusibacter TaxID=2624464 RepID=UPI001010D12D|nr:MULTISPECIES: Stp1/IreP family PP2C-type Ser/Thr phosphatase [unclassified Fusibacter]MCK8058056.1 Stp1/IreP family PP2C-type Ser/Thr phosphatase [Fusibacter sp. A2]NPE20638.1 Stp1/IreP family PP2C-type Ser/Thr phosphatase [Fusibacter sp. A1]RXV62845.1 Stp1/IreP family PP2C-type Ser/Thr phosphatase [Fusibacter sp. A1]